MIVIRKLSSEHDYMMVDKYWQDLLYFVGYGGRSTSFLKSDEEAIARCEGLLKDYEKLNPKPKWLSKAHITAMKNLIKKTYLVNMEAFNFSNLTTKGGYFTCEQCITTDTGEIFVRKYYITKLGTLIKFEVISEGKIVRTFKF